MSQEEVIVYDPNLLDVYLQGEGDQEFLTSMITSCLQREEVDVLVKKIGEVLGKCATNIDENVDVCSRALQILQTLLEFKYDLSFDQCCMIAQPLIRICSQINQLNTLRQVCSIVNMLLLDDNFHFLVTCEEFDRSDLIQIGKRLPYVGDYESQALILETLVRISQNNRATWAKLWFSDKETIQMFTDLNASEFEASCRNVLNAVNNTMSSHQKVFSQIAMTAFLGEYEVQKTQSDLWIDFNYCSWSVSFYCLDPFFEPSDSESGLPMWETICIYSDLVNSCCLKVMPEAEVQELIFELKVPYFETTGPPSLMEESQKYHLKNATQIKILFPDAVYLQPYLEYIFKDLYKGPNVVTEHEGSSYDTSFSSVPCVEQEQYSTNDPSFCSTPIFGTNQRPHFVKSEPICYDDQITEDEDSKLLPQAFSSPSYSLQDDYQKSNIASRSALEPCYSPKTEQLENDLNFVSIKSALANTDSHEQACIQPSFEHDESNFSPMPVSIKKEMNSSSDSDLKIVFHSVGTCPAESVLKFEDSAEMIEKMAQVKNSEELGNDLSHCEQKYIKKEVIQQVDKEEDTESCIWANEITIVDGVVSSYMSLSPEAKNVMKKVSPHVPRSHDLVDGHLDHKKSIHDDFKDNKDENLSNEVSNVRGYQENDANIDESKLPRSKAAAAGKRSTNSAKQVQKRNSKDSETKSSLKDYHQANSDVSKSPSIKKKRGPKRKNLFDADTMQTEISSPVNGGVCETETGSNVEENVDDNSFRASKPKRVTKKAKTASKSNKKAQEVVAKRDTEANVQDVDTEAEKSRAPVPTASIKTVQAAMEHLSENGMSEKLVNGDPEVEKTPLNRRRASKVDTNAVSSDKKSAHDSGFATISCDKKGAVLEPATPRRRRQWRKRKIELEENDPDYADADAPKKTDSVVTPPVEKKSSFKEKVDDVKKTVPRNRTTSRKAALSSMEKMKNLLEEDKSAHESSVESDDNFTPSTDVKEPKFFKSKFQARRIAALSDPESENSWIKGKDKETLLFETPKRTYDIPKKEKAKRKSKEIQPEIQNKRSPSSNKGSKKWSKIDTVPLVDTKPPNANDVNDSGSVKDKEDLIYPYASCWDEGMRKACNNMKLTSEDKSRVMDMFRSKKDELFDAMMSRNDEKVHEVIGIAKPELSTSLANTVVPPTSQVNNKRFSRSKTMKKEKAPTVKSSENPNVIRKNSDQLSVPKSSLETGCLPSSVSDITKDTVPVSKSVDSTFRNHVKDSSGKVTKFSESRQKKTSLDVNVDMDEPCEFSITETSPIREQETLRLKKDNHNTMKTDEGYSSICETGASTSKKEKGFRKKTKEVLGNIKPSTNISSRNINTAIEKPDPLSGNRVSLPVSGETVLADDRNKIMDAEVLSFDDKAMKATSKFTVGDFSKKINKTSKDTSCAKLCNGNMDIATKKCEQLSTQKVSVITSNGTQSTDEMEQTTKIKKPSSGRKTTVSIPKKNAEVTKKTKEILETRNDVLNGNANTAMKKLDPLSNQKVSSTTTCEDLCEDMDDQSATFKVSAGKDMKKPSITLKNQNGAAKTASEMKKTSKKINKTQFDMTSGQNAPQTSCKKLPVDDFVAETPIPAIQQPVASTPKPSNSYLQWVRANKKTIPSDEKLTPGKSTTHDEIFNRRLNTPCYMAAVKKIIHNFENISSSPPVFDVSDDDSVVNMQSSNKKPKIENEEKEDAASEVLFLSDPSVDIPNGKDSLMEKFLKDAQGKSGASHKNHSDGNSLSVNMSERNGYFQENHVMENSDSSTEDTDSDDSISSEVSSLPIDCGNDQLVSVHSFARMVKESTCDLLNLTTSFQESYIKDLQNYKKDFKTGSNTKDGVRQMRMRHWLFIKKKLKQIISNVDFYVKSEKKQDPELSKNHKRDGRKQKTRAHANYEKRFMSHLKKVVLTILQQNASMQTSDC